MIKPEGSPEIKGYMYPETSSDEEMDDSISEDEGDEATSDGEKEIDRPSVQEDLVEKISEHRIKNTKKENPKNCNEEEVRLDIWKWEWRVFLTSFISKLSFRHRKDLSQNIPK